MDDRLLATINPLRRVTSKREHASQDVTWARIAAIAQHDSEASTYSKCWFRKVLQSIRIGVGCLRYPLRYAEFRPLCPPTDPTTNKLAQRWFDDLCE
jgi:hypothetical protein